MGKYVWEKVANVFTDEKLARKYLVSVKERKQHRPGTRFMVKKVKTTRELWCGAKRNEIGYQIMKGTPKL